MPFVLSWPKGIDERARGQVRREYQYVTDLLPTLLELTGVERPKQFRGVEVVALDGVSFAASLNDGDYVSAHREQYSEFMGNRSFYKDGWKFVSLHRPGAPYDDQEWELYDIREDPTERTNVALERPGLVRELSRRGSAVRGTTRSSRSTTSPATWERSVDRSRIDLPNRCGSWRARRPWSGTAHRSS